MKTQTAKSLALTAAIIILSSSVTFADAKVTQNGDLATGFSFTDVFNKIFGSDTGNTASDAGPSMQVMKMDVASDSTDTAGDISAQVSPVLATTTASSSDEDPDLNSCEHFDNAVSNLLTLESASSDTKLKLDNVEDTLDNESSLRDSILSSMKDLFGLQKQDKTVFKQMKKDIADARTYYANLDKKTDTLGQFLDENSCDATPLIKAKKIDTDSTKLVTDEASFRKTLVAGLKDKMSVLQASVQEAKK